MDLWFTQRKKVEIALGVYFKLQANNKVHGIGLLAASPALTPA